MRHQDKIKISEKEREQLHKIIRQGEHKAQVIRNAHIILKSVAGWRDDAIAEAYQVHKRTVIRVRNHFRVHQNEELLVALSHKPRSGAPISLGDKIQAMVIAKACTLPPPGAEHWSLELLSAKLEGEIGRAISRESVRLILKKTNCSPMVRNNGASRK